MELQKECSLCRNADFLPFTCLQCSKLFCTDHRFNHGCKDSINEIIPIQESLKKGCDFKDCKTVDIISSSCQICSKSFCLKHRHSADHDCIKQEAVIKPEKKIVKIKTKPNPKIDLMKLKQSAKGNGDIPMEQRAYFKVNEKNLFFKKEIVVGKLLDLCLKELGMLFNENLGLYGVDTSGNETLLNTSDKIEDLFTRNISMQVSFRQLDGLVSDIKPEIPIRQRTIVPAKRIHLHISPTPPPPPAQKRKLVRKSCVVSNVQVKTPTIPHKKKTRKTAHIESPIFRDYKDNKTSILGLERVQLSEPSLILEKDRGIPETPKKMVHDKKIDLNLPGQKVNLQDVKISVAPVIEKPKTDILSAKTEILPKVDLTTPPLEPVELPKKSHLGLTGVEKRAPVEKIELAAKLLLDRQTIPKKIKKRPKSPELITESPKPKRLNPNERKEIREFIKSKKLQEKDKEMEKEIKSKQELERRKKNLEILNLKRKLRLDMNVQRKIEIDKKVKDEEIQTEIKKEESKEPMVQTLPIPDKKQDTVEKKVESINEPTDKPKSDIKIGSNALPESLKIDKQDNSVGNRLPDPRAILSSTIEQTSLQSAPQATDPIEAKQAGQNRTNSITTEIQAVHQKPDSKDIASVVVSNPIESAKEHSAPSPFKGSLVIPVETAQTPSKDPRFEKVAQQIKLLEKRVQDKLNKEELDKLKETEKKASDIDSVTGLIEKMNYLASIIIEKKSEGKKEDAIVIKHEESKLADPKEKLHLDPQVGATNTVEGIKEKSVAKNSTDVDISKIFEPESFLQKEHVEDLSKAAINNPSMSFEQKEKMVDVKPIIPLNSTPKLNFEIPKPVVIPSVPNTGDSQIGVGSLRKFDYMLHHNKQRQIAALKIQAFYKRRLKKRVNSLILKSGLVDVEQSDVVDSFKHSLPMPSIQPAKLDFAGKTSEVPLKGTHPSNSAEIKHSEIPFGVPKELVEKNTLQENSTKANSGTWPKNESKSIPDNSLKAIFEPDQNSMFNIFARRMVVEDDSLAKHLKMKEDTTSLSVDSKPSMVDEKGAKKENQTSGVSGETNDNIKANVKEVPKDVEAAKSVIEKQPEGPIITDEKQKIRSGEIVQSTEQVNAAKVPQPVKSVEFSNSIHYNFPSGGNISFKDDISSITSDYSEYSDNFEQISDLNVNQSIQSVPPINEKEKQKQMADASNTTKSDSFENEESSYSSSSTSDKSSPPVRNYTYRNSQTALVKDNLMGTTGYGKLDPASIGLKLEMELNYFEVVGDNILQVTELQNNREKAQYEQEIQGLAQIYMEELAKAKSERIENSKFSVPPENEYAESFDSISDIPVESPASLERPTPINVVQKIEEQMLNKPPTTGFTENFIDPFESSLPEQIKSDVYQSSRPYTPIFENFPVSYPIDNIISRNSKNSQISEIEEKIEERIRQKTPSIEENIVSEIVPVIKPALPKKDEIKIQQLAKKLEHVRNHYTDDSESSISEIISKSVSAETNSDLGICSEDSIIEYLARRKQRNGQAVTNRDGSKTPTQRSPKKKRQVVVDSDSSCSDSQDSMFELDELSKLLAKARRSAQRDIIKGKKISALEDQMREVEAMKKSVSRNNIESLRNILTKWNQPVKGGKGSDVRKYSYAQEEKTNIQEFVKKVKTVQKSDDESSIEEDFESYKSEDSIKEDIYEDSFESISEILSNVQKNEDDISETFESIQDDLSSLHTDLKLKAMSHTLVKTEPLQEPPRKDVSKVGVGKSANVPISGLDWPSIVHAFTDILHNMLEPPTKKNEAQLMGLLKEYTQATKNLEIMLKMKDEKENLVFQEQAKLISEGIKIIQSKTAELTKADVIHTEVLEATKVSYDKLKSTDIAARNTALSVSAPVEPQPSMLKKSDSAPITTKTEQVGGSAAPIRADLKDVESKLKIVDDITEEIVEEYDDDFDDISSISKLSSIVIDKDISLVKETILNNQPSPKVDLANILQPTQNALGSTLKSPTESLKTSNEGYAVIESVQKETVVKPTAQTTTKTDSFEKIQKGTSVMPTSEATMKKEETAPQIVPSIEMIQKETLKQDEPSIRSDIQPQPKKIDESAVEEKSLQPQTGKIEPTLVKDVVPTSNIAIDVFNVPDMSSTNVSKTVAVDDAKTTPQATVENVIKTPGQPALLVGEIEEDIEYEDDFDDVSSILEKQPAKGDGTLSLNVEMNVYEVIKEKQDIIPKSYPDKGSIVVDKEEIRPKSDLSLANDYGSSQKEQASIASVLEKPIKDISFKSAEQSDSEMVERITEELISSCLEEVVELYLHSKSQVAVNVPTSITTPVNVETAQHKVTKPKTTENEEKSEANTQKTLAPMKPNIPKMSINIPAEINKVTDVLGQTSLANIQTPVSNIDKAIVLTPLPDQQLSDAKLKSEKTKTSNPDLSVIPLDMQMMFALESILDAFKASFPPTKAFSESPSLPQKYLDEFSDISRDILPLIFDAINESFYSQFQAHREFADPLRHYFKKVPLKPRPVLINSLISNTRNEVLNWINCHSQYNNIPVANTLTNNFVKFNAPNFCNREQDDIAINLQIRDELMEELLDDLATLLLSNQ
ncbi:AN1-type zinc finger protein 1 [Boothiomyces sp. JEL0838]|nr:AN1-type zinc finger protein 1 [Boothiomyces sp. JEL0838]